LTKLVETYNFKNKLERKHNALAGDNIVAQNQRKQNREQLIKQYIKNPAAQQVWRKAHGMELCDYHKIFEILKYDFTEFTFSKRKLEQNNLMECFRVLGMNQDLTVNIEKFDSIYNWFNGLTRLVQILSDYYNKINPVIIHGFLSRDDAHKMLLEKNRNIPIGTFIIRFRYKQPKSIAISYKQSNHNVSNIKCDLSNNNDYTFICGKKLLPLPQFILNFHPLKYLYHHQLPIPKDQIFNILHSNPNNNNNENQQISIHSASNPQLDQMHAPSWNNTKSWNPPQSKRAQQSMSYNQHREPHHHNKQRHKNPNFASQAKSYNPTQPNSQY